jgi:hypothetical protein
MRPKQGVVIFRFDDALLNLTNGREYAGPKNRFRLRPSREQEWRGGDEEKVRMKVLIIGAAGKIASQLKTRRVRYRKIA